MNNQHEHGCRDLLGVLNRNMWAETVAAVTGAYEDFVLVNRDGAIQTKLQPWQAMLKRGGRMKPKASTAEQG